MRLVSSLSNVTTDTKMATLEILPLHSHFLLNKAAFMYRVLNDYAPCYMKDLFQPTPSPYTTFKHNLICPRPRLDIYKTSISFSGAHVWNMLPKQLKMQTSVTSFKTALHKLHLLNSDYRR